MKKLILNKKVYKYKDVENLLGNDMGFSSLNPKPKSSNAFFKTYNENFYDLKKQTHNDLVVKSTEYIGPLDNPRTVQLNSLKKDKERIQLQIDSTDREHPYFSNGTILMHKDYNQSHVSGFGGISSEGDIKGPKYYMHSGKKRKIPDDYLIYSKIKNRLGMKDLKDADIIIFLWSGGLDAISDGPPITRLQDLFISFYEVNMYKPT